MNELWVGVRLVKILAVAVYFVGLVDATTAPSARRRLVGALVTGPLGLVLAWAAGWWLMRTSGRSMGTGWIAAGALLSFVAMHSATFVAFARARAEVHRVVALGAATATIGAMVGHAASSWGWWAIIAGLVGTIWGLASWRMPPLALTNEVGFVGRAFRAAALVEAATGLAVLLQGPLHALWGVTFDGGTGLLGWVHGTLFLLTLQALPAVARALGWPVSRAVQVGLLLLVPGAGLFIRPVPVPVPR